jgi:hypothetical protein
VTTTTERLDRATYQRRWTAELMAWRDEAAERWTAAWTEWREATEQFDDAATVTVLPEKWPSAEDLGRWEFVVYFQSIKWLWPSEAIITMSPLPTRRPSDVLAEAYQERADAAEAYMRAGGSDEMPGRDAGGWTPTRPMIVVDIPVPDLVQTGPQGRFGRWFDGQLQRAERWWRRKQAERDARMELED